MPSTLDTARELAAYAMNRIRTDRVPQVAGALTYTSVLALVPMLAVAFALLTAFPVFQSFQKALQAWMFESLVPDGISNQVLRYINQFSSKAKGLTAFGLIGLGATAIMTLVTIENAFNDIWRVRTRRPLGQRLLIFWATITIGPVLFGASLSIGGYLIPASAGKSAVLGLFLDALSIALSFLAFTALYGYVPNTKVERRDAMAGGAFSALVFELSKNGFGSFISHFPTYTAVYGAFAAVPIFLIWMYVSWLITLAGAELAAGLPVVRSGLWRRRDFPGAALFDALGVLHLLHQARANSRRGLGETDLARELRLWPEQMIPALDTLCKLKLVAKLERSADEKGEPLWVLACDPAQVQLQSLVRAFSLDGALDNPKLETTLDQLFH
ncbi:MAG: YihY family inner membrane protein [Candidatus Protistobacter heckmanni]|nr:YihY family inner membrane protein [Candidatus Protistobacter heckmanni]